MLAKREAIASLHSDFYRQQYYRLLRWLMMLLFIMLLLIGVILYVIFTEPQRPFLRQYRRWKNFIDATSSMMFTK